MKFMGASRLILILLLFASPAFGYDILFDADDPTDLGTVPVNYQYPGQSSISSNATRWKAARLQASSSGTVTHFLVRVCTADNSNNYPIGFAVYADAGASTNPGALIKRGYVASHSFANTGWYAFPFLNDDTFSVTSGTYYHVTVLLNYIESDWGSYPLNKCRMDLTDPPASWGSNPDKWFSSCGDGPPATCDYEEPPGVGGEGDWNALETSAGWVQGLLITEEASPAPIRGLKIN